MWLTALVVTIKWWGCIFMGFMPFTCNPLRPYDACILTYWSFNTLRPRQNRRHFADDTFKHIFLNENVRISIKISLKFVPKGPFNNNSALVQIKAWRRPGDKPLSEPMMVRSLAHICVTRPQWVKKNSSEIWLKIRVFIVRNAFENVGAKCSLCQ